MPNLFKTLFSFRRKSVATYGNQIGFTGFENSTDIHNLNSYKDSLYLYIGVNMIAKRVAGVPLELYKVKNKAGDVEEVFTHPLLDVLYNPNPHQTQREFFELSVAHYLLSGDAFWYLERAGNSKKIVGLHVLRPDFVQIALSADRKDIVAYEYNNHGILRFKPEDVLHFKNIDPSNPLRGVGVVRPATQRILTEQEASKYQTNFFKNQGRPDIALFANRAISPEDSDEARARWKAIYGAGKGGQVAFFGSDITKMETLNVNPKEMDFIASQNFLRDDILASLHIPKAMVTSDNVNLANAQTAKVMYLEEAVLPVLDMFIDVINNKLIPTIDVSVFLDYENPVPADRAIVLEEAKAGVGKWLTQNEVRETYNLPPMEGGDMLQDVTTITSQAQSQDLTSKAKSVVRKRPLLSLKFKAIEDVLQSLKTPEVKREMNSIFTTKAMKDNFAKAFNDNVDKKADIVLDAINAFHKGQLERVLDNNKDGFDPVTFMNATMERGMAHKALLPVFIDLYTKAGKDTLTGLFNPKKSIDQFYVDAVLLKELDARALFFATSVTDTTFEVLKSKIVDGIGAGDGIDKIGRSIRDYFTDMEVSRAKTIARTETGFLLSKATNDAYSQSTVITGKEWITVGDDKVREEHVQNDGVIVNKDGAFPNGEHYPADDSINCRCVLAPAV